MYICWMNDFCKNVEVYNISIIFFKVWLEQYLAKWHKSMDDMGNTLIWKFNNIKLARENDILLLKLGFLRKRDLGKWISKYHNINIF